MSLTRQPSWVYTAAAPVPAVVYAAAPTIPDPGLHIAAGVAALTWLIAFAVYAWIRLDEPSREAHKFAWFWGGAAGLLVVELIAVGALVAPLLREPVAAFVKAASKGGVSAESGFMVGVFAAAIAQIIGYGLVWTGWWLSKRGQG